MIELGFGVYGLIKVVIGLFVKGFVLEVGYVGVCVNVIVLSIVEIVLMGLFK